MCVPDKKFVGLLDECPCHGCVAPKRFSGCHAVCQEYIPWNTARQQYLEKMHETQRRESNCFPTRLRKNKHRRKY